MNITNTSSHRYVALDWICGLLIIHMIIGHICQWADIDYVLDEILFFFMPWFFFKGGMFHKSTDMKTMITKCAHRLLVPFVVFSIIGQIIYSIKIIAEQEPIHNLNFIKTVLFQGAFPGNLALWFLLTLFAVKVIYNYLRLNNIPSYFIIISSFLITICFHFIPFRVPYYFANFFSGMFFYTLGYSLREKQFTFKILACSFITLFVIAAYSPTFVDMRSNHLANGYYILWFPYCTAAIIVFDNFIKIIPQRYLNYPPYI